MGDHVWTAQELRAIAQQAAEEAIELIVPVALTGRKLKVGKLQATYSTQVDAGAVSSINITPTAGYIGRLLAVGYYAPAVAGSTGSHSIILNIGAAAGTTYNSLQDASIAGTSALNVRPLTTADGYKGAIFDASNPLVLTYYAPSTNPQTGSRSAFALWEEEAVV